MQFDSLNLHIHVYACIFSRPTTWALTFHTFVSKVHVSIIVSYVHFSKWECLSEINK